MFTENELTNDINNLTSKIKTEYVFFHAGVLGVSKEDFILKKVKEIIKVYDLKSKTKKREFIYKRFYLFNFLSNSNLKINYTQIGKLFDKNHATVLNGLKQHNDLMQFSDEVYLEYTKPICDIISDSNFDKLIQSGYEETANAESLDYCKIQLENIATLSKKIEELKELYQK
tara:strand:+ start:42 stop:557 length:516 start_codon:yes stop_codon:yes gene_type:complete